LVTGGAGFIGSHLVDALLQLGHEVTVLDDLSSGHRRNLEGTIDRIQFVEGSVEDSELVRKSADGCAGIFHLAAVVSVPKSIEDPIGSHRVNTMGTLHVLHAARTLGAKVIFSSSAAVYGDDPEMPKHEALPTIPISPYGVQKLTGEEYAQLFHRLYGLSAVCLRYFNVFGPRQDPRSPYSGVISIFAERARLGQPIRINGDGTQTRDFVFVEDVVRANLAAMASDVEDGRTYNVGTGTSTELLSLANLVIELSGNTSRIEHRPPRPGDIHHSLASIERAKQELGYQPAVFLREGLRKTFANGAHPIDVAS
jgi:UDP-glucose 4-epimerase